MEREYKLTKETAAIVACLDDVVQLQSRIYDALCLHYDTSQMDIPCGSEHKKGIGAPIFECLQCVEDELLLHFSKFVHERLQYTQHNCEI